MAKAESKNPVKTLTAGGIAGALEAFIMFPTEYVKTQIQLEGAAVKKAKAAGLPPDQWPKPRFTGIIDCAKVTFKEKGIFGFYRGVNTLVIGSIPKAGVRFMAYEQFASLLRDPKTGKTNTLLAGMGAGIAEAIFAVTPMETVKTKMIHDVNQPVRKYKGLAHGVATMLREEGLGGIYKGLVPTCLKQGCNQAVRFTVFDGIKGLVLTGGKKEFTATESLVYGGIAGIISVYATMPFDVIKTRMQGLEAKQYSSSFDCAKKIAADEGVLAYWKGTVPRLSRVMFSSGIIFTFYEIIMRELNKQWPEPTTKKPVVAAATAAAPAVAAVVAAPAPTPAAAPAPAPAVAPATEAAPAQPKA